MTRIHANNFETTLNGGITNVATSMILTSVTGFPTIGAGVTCNLTIEDGGNIEIVQATARSSFTITIVRAQESTTGLAWSSGATVSLRATADSLDRKADLASPTFTGTVTLPSGQALIAPALGTVASGNISACTSSGQVLTAPVLGTPASGTLTNCTGLPVAGAGTGRASHTAYAVICGGTTSTGAQQSIASVGTSGQVLTSNGAGALPTFQAAGGGGSSGDVVGPSSATDNGFARFDTTTGKLIQNTGTNSTLSDGGLAAFGSYLTLEATNIRIWSGSTVVTTSLGVGALSLNAQTSGGLQNTGCGYSSLRLLTSGDRNTAMGHTALDALLTNADNSAFGDAAFVTATGSNGCAFGSGCFSGITSGSQNVGMGVQVGTANASGAAGLTSAANNTLLGYRASADTNNTIGTIALGSDAVSTKATGATSGDNGPGIAIGSAAFPVGFRGDATIYSAVGASAGYWRVKINGTQYKIQLFADS